MRTGSPRGFTLVELLTVIAIIAILAALTATVLPGVLERAKITTTINNFNQIRTALTTYFTDHGSYPPHYGFYDFQVRNVYEETGTVPASNRFTLPMMSYIGNFRNFDLYDNWSDNHDADNDGVIDILEYVAVNSADFGPPVYLSNDPVTGARANEQRPFVYLPVQERQFRQVERFYVNHAANVDLQEGWYAEVWDHDDPALDNKDIPPPKYDKFALISVGPVRNTFGIIDVPQALLSPNEGPDQVGLYHRAVLRAYFLATRDANDNNLLDFDYRARTREGEGREVNYSDPLLTFLPDGSRLQGPLIFVSP